MTFIRIRDIALLPTQEKYTVVPAFVTVWSYGYVSTLRVPVASIFKVNIEASETLVPNYQSIKIKYYRRKLFLLSC